VKPLMRWMHQYAANRNVFNDHLKLFPSMTGSHKLSGREIQTDGLTDQPQRKPIGLRYQVWQNKVIC